MNCSLGLDCTQMGLDECGECVNEELCHRYTEAWDLYEIVLLKGLPGAVYLCRHGRAFNIDWTDEKWGFKRLNNSDWLIHHTASLNTFAEWKHAYYVLSNRHTTKYVRSDLFEEFDLLRKQVDIEYAKNHEDDDKAPFLFE